MKILYLNPSGELGGAERSLLFLMAGLRTARPEWQMQLVAGSGGPLIRRAEEIGVQASAMDFPRSLSKLGDAGAGGPAGLEKSHLRLVGDMGRAGVPSIAYLRRLRRTLARFAPDLIHSNGFKMHILAAWARPAGCPLIWHIRDYVSARPFMSRLIRANAHRCTVAIANSTSVAEDLRTVCGDKLRIHRVYNGVDLSTFSPPETLRISTAYARCRRLRRIRSGWGCSRRWRVGKVTRFFFERSRKPRAYRRSAHM